MLRYTVIRNPPGRRRVGGYALHDHQPTPILGEDVEGVGWCSFNLPKPGSSVVCWFRYKRDAIKHANLLNRGHAARTRGEVTRTQINAIGRSPLIGESIQPRRRRVSPELFGGT